jgi:hypothetical protein
MSDTDKKATKMIVTVGWGVVVGIVAKVVIDAPMVVLLTLGTLLGLASIFLGSSLLWLLIEATIDLFNDKPKRNLDTISEQVSDIRKGIEELRQKFYFVPKADLAQAIESIELNDTSTALALLKAVVEKAGRDE